MLPHRPLWSITTLLTIAYRFRPDFPESLDTLLVSFNGLTSFGFSEMIKGYIFDEELESRSIPAVIAANTGTLRTLRGLSDEVWAQLPPLSNFAHLHELEIVAIQSYDGLHALFEHCAALHAFTLLHATQELIPVLHNHPQALPDLDSFKIWGVHYTVDDITVLAKFVRQKRHLRRLDVMVRTYTHRRRTEDPSPVLMPLLEILNTLPDLRILGLSFRVTSPEGDHVRYLEAHLPKNLTALLVWMDRPSVSVPAQHWIELVRTGQFSSAQPFLTHSTGIAVVVLTLQITPVSARRPHL